ncbi:MAG: glycoside hydrolase domain-containing protein [Phycisphaerae bacterium]
MSYRPAAFVLTIAAIVSTVWADGDVKPILDTSSFWRCYYVLKAPVFRTEKGIVPLPEAFPSEWKTIQGDRFAKWLMLDTAQPPESWTQSDFDDSTWCRMPAYPATKAWEKGVFIFRRSCYMGMECRRGRLEVTDPQRAGDLSLAVTYIGGLSVWLNGKEVARDHLPKEGALGPDTLADDYRQAKDQQRTLTVRLPSAQLRKGVNVLALAIYRAPHEMADVNFPTRDNWRRAFILGATCGLVGVRLDAPKDSAVTPNVGRPAAMQVWNSDVLSPDFDMDYGDPNEPLRPISIVAAANGSFSGKVVVGSAAPITNLTAQASDLTQHGGTGKVPASSIRLRYALPGVLTTIEGRIDIVHYYGGSEAGAEARYLAEPSRFDALADEPPKDVPVRKKQVLKQSLRSEGVEPSFGAVVPVWMTVQVPPGTPEGDYEGKLTLRADGAGPFEVSVKLRVCGWTLPDPKDFRTFCEMVQSPETVALWYGVPLWSDEHFRLLERPLELIGRAGAKTLYIPLICETNMGNAQSMVPWIRKADGTYSHDYRAMDRYLDLAAKYMGKPEVVCFCVWDCFLSSVGRQGWGTDATKNYQGGPEVIVLDQASGAAEKVQLPPYSDAKSKDLWQPLLEGIRKRMKDRGLEDRMMLGLVSDRTPDKATAAFFGEMLPGIRWVSCAHGWPKDVGGAPFGYQANPLGSSQALDPSVSRQHGWQRPNLVANVHFARLLQDNYPLTTFRFLGERNIAGDSRGFARLGADFWPVLKNKAGERTGSIAARYPKSSWWNLNIVTSLLAPGPRGAVATVRYETLREGLQECEARIFIERALLDKGTRAALGEDLAKRCQEVLDERTRAMLRGQSSLIQVGGWNANYSEDWWEQPGVIGSEWFACSGWQARTRDLYEAAAEVARKNGK